MGLAKASLPFGNELMLPRVARRLGEVVDQLVVVAAAGQEIPPLPAAVSVVHDRRADRGPLEGLAAGLAALPEQVEAAYVTACDVPLLETRFVVRLFELLGEAAIAVPRVDGYHHPLSAVYRRSVLPEVEALLAADRLRPFFLFERVATREVAAEEWADVDPQSRTLANLNRPADYLAAAAEAGFEVPAEIRARLGGED
ncbi:MAG: molybdenum cofactor guanylyltransferase [Planctomycetota bacterium]|nr:MAG: molybdenum cofactor guanylyltransferase [Planctomycetota bacterium]REJ92759.1 MAG: molybdenum cofactor guanylyltransferase [Planctomycetota bacterium]REK23711.1 MAG: molybdenum cofactor guanylyltransferase [Planctomycetota bacterium]REK47648.1 MAG: molybdenum cofactor guanylyltransferase [Planctomycetota bacterium]